MSNKKSTSRALILSVVSMLLCCSMLVGTTFAWFTDSVESGNNQIIAGNLDVELDYWNGTEYVTVEGATDIFDPNALWEPGHAEVAYLKIGNNGNLALKYFFSLNIIGETIGLTQPDANGVQEEITLSEHLKFGIVEDVAADAYGTDRAAAIAAVTDPQPLTEALTNQHEYASLASTTPMAPDAEKTLALVVWMPTEVGNEANHDGENVPAIYLGVNLIATQVEAELDSFGNDYDTEAKLPVVGTGTVELNNQSAYDVPVRSRDGANLGSVLVTEEAVAAGATSIVASIEKTATNPNITVATGSVAETYEITVEGLADNISAENAVKVTLRLATGMDPATVKVYHYDEEIASDYNPNTGYVTFETTSFSPFTAVYDPNSKYETPDAPEGKYPTATVTYEEQYVGDKNLAWGSYGQWSPTAGLDSDLEAAFTFECPDYEKADDDTKKIIDAYRYWYCDFFVSLDANLGENQIFLGGNYGSFGWVGFHNGDLTLPANTYLPLLSSVTTNPWTYSDVEANVGEFICGVGDVDDALEGKTFTVQLRLIDPSKVKTTAENEWWNDLTEDDYIVVNTVTYTFGGDYTIQ